MWLEKLNLSEIYYINVQLIRVSYLEFKSKKLLTINNTALYLYKTTINTNVYNYIIIVTTRIH